MCTFLKALSGESSTILRGKGSTVDDLLQPWESWSVGFSHFLQLSVEVLWALLARCAACILPRGFIGIDLLIPIFKGPELSMILIQAKKCARDSSYPMSAVNYTRPDYVFEGALKSLKREDVPRVYMSLCGVAHLEQYFYVDNIDNVRKSARIAEQEKKNSPSPASSTSPTASSVAVAEAASGQGTKPDSAAVHKPNESKKTPFVLCL